MNDAQSKLDGPLIGHWAQIPTAILVLLAIIAVFILRARPSEFHSRRELHAHMYYVEYNAVSDLWEAIHRGEEIASPVEFILTRIRDHERSKLLCSRGNVLLNPDPDFWTEGTEAREEEWAILIETTSQSGERIWVGSTLSGKQVVAEQYTDVPEWFADGISICDE